MRRYFVPILTIAVIAAIGFFTVSHRASDVDPEPPITPEPNLIGIVQFVHHPLLDETHRGIFSELNALGLNDGQRYTVKTRVAEKDVQLCSQITRQFVDQHAALIIAIATPAAQAAKSVLGETTPMVFAAITDPVAAGLVATLDHPGGSATGTSNRWPFDRQLRLVPEILPNITTIGTLWNPGEVNSDAAMKYIRPLAKSMGIQVVESPVSSTGDVTPAARSIADRVDAFFVVPDNTVLAATAALVQVSKEVQTPIIGGDQNTVRQGSLATFGYDYFELGQVTARMVAKILLDGEKPQTMPVRFPPTATLIVNPSSAENYGIALPAELVDDAAEVVSGS